MPIFSSERMSNNILRFYAPVVVSWLFWLGQDDRFFAENWTSIYGCIVFSEKCTSWTNQDSYGVSTGPQNIQKDQYFHHEKWSERSGAIKPTSYTKKLKNRIKTAMGLNDDKMIVLIQPQKVLEWSWFFVYELVILLPLTGHNNQARSSLYRVPRCAQARPLFKIVRTMRFCAKYVTDKKWR